MHAHAIGTRPLFPLLGSLGTRLAMADIDIVMLWIASGQRSNLQLNLQIIL